jgi:hypothetical protein
VVGVGGARASAARYGISQPVIVALATYYNPYTLLLHEEINAHWLKLSSALIHPNHVKMSGSVTAKTSGNHVTNTKLQHHYSYKELGAAAKKKPSAEPPEEPGWQAMSLFLLITAITHRNLSASALAIAATRLTTLTMPITLTTPTILTIHAPGR